MGSFANVESRQAGDTVSSELKSLEEQREVMGSALTDESECSVKQKNKELKKKTNTCSPAALQAWCPVEAAAPFALAVVACCGFP